VNCSKADEIVNGKYVVEEVFYSTCIINFVQSGKWTSMCTQYAGRKVWPKYLLRSNPTLQRQKLTILHAADVLERHYINTQTVLLRDITHASDVHACIAIPSDRLSICLSVCLSVTLVNSVKMVEQIKLFFLEKRLSSSCPTLCYKEIFGGPTIRVISP